MSIFPSPAKPDWGVAAKMRFANVMDDAGELVVTISGTFNSELFENKWNPSAPQIYFRPTDLTMLNKVDALFDSPETGYTLDGWTIKRAVHDGTIRLKLKKYEDVWEFKINESPKVFKGRQATVTMNPSYFFDDDKKIAGVFYKVVEVEFK